MVSRNVRMTRRILFWCEDDGLGISVTVLESFKSSATCSISSKDLGILLLGSAGAAEVERLATSKCTS